MIPRSQSVNDIHRGNEIALQDLIAQSNMVTPVKERILVKVASTSKMISSILSKIKVENPDPKIPKTAIVKNSGYFPSDFFASNNNHRQINVQLKKKPLGNITSSHQRWNLPLDLKRSSFNPLSARGTLPTPKFSSTPAGPLFSEQLVKPVPAMSEVREASTEESPVISPVIEKNEDVKLNPGQTFSNQALMTFLPVDTAKLSPIQGMPKRSTSVPKLIIFKRQEPNVIPSPNLGTGDNKAADNSVCNTSTTTGTPLTHRDSVDNIKKQASVPIFKEISKLADFEALKPIKKILKQTNSSIIAQPDGSSKTNTPQPDKKKKITIKINRSQPVIAQDSLSSLNLKNCTVTQDTVADGLASERDTARRSRTENLTSEAPETTQNNEGTPGKRTGMLPSIFQNLLKTRSGSRTRSVGEEHFNVKQNFIPDVRVMVENNKMNYITPQKNRNAAFFEVQKNSSQGKIMTSLDKRNNSVDHNAHLNVNNIPNNRILSTGKLIMYNLNNSAQKSSDQLNFSFNKENDIEEANSRKGSDFKELRGLSEDARGMNSYEKENHANRFAQLLDSSNSKSANKRRIMINAKLQNKFF